MHHPSSSSGVAQAAARNPSPGRGVQRVIALASAVLSLAASVLPGVAQTPLAHFSATASPVGVALDTVAGTTYLYVADESRGSVLKLNASTGVVVATLGSPGTQPGQFGRPYGVAVDPVSHDLYVTERLNGRVQRIDSLTGAPIMAWGVNDAVFNAGGQSTSAPNPNAAPGHFQEPIGIAADASGNIYVVDHGNNRVQKFLVSQAAGSWTAAPVAQWGGTGSGNGQFDRPYGIALDAAGNVWVADGLNGRVQQFTPTGTHVATVGAKGTAPGQFVIATWVGFDSAGALYVTSTNADPQAVGAADINNQWMSKFSTTGSTPAFVSRFGGTYGTAAGEFKLPFGVVIDGAGKAYVSDYYNARVQVFDLAGAPGGGGTSGPTVTAFAVDASTATSADFRLTFSSAVTGVDAADFTVTPSQGVTASVASVSGTGASYTIRVTYSGTGSMQLALASSGTGITDAAGKPLTNGGTTSATFTTAGGGGGTTDTVPPTVSSFVTGTAAAGSVTFQLTFTEAVTGVDATDFTVATGGGAAATIASVSGAGTAWGVSVTVSGTGTVQVTLKATGTAIVDTSGNALSSGAIGPLHAIGADPGGGGAGTVSIVGGSVPAGGTYRAGDALVVRVRFSGPVFVKGDSGERRDVKEKDKDDKRKDKDDDDDDDGKDDDDDDGPFIAWKALSGAGGADSGRLKYQGGSGTSELTFKYQVHGNDTAYSGIELGTAIELPHGSSVRDSAGRTVAVSAIAWAQNPLPAVVLVRANESNPGADKRNGTPATGGVGSGPSKRRSAGLANVSSRVHVKGRDAVRATAVGFVVSGSSPQSLLIRAVGPGLRVFGIESALATPELAVRNSSGASVATNRGWGNDGFVASVTQKVGAFSLGSGSRDSALVITLAPGAYTATIAADADGEALIEVYNANATEAVDAQLVNISTRGFIEPGASLITGFVIQGNEPKRVLVRAAGPGLAAFGVSGALGDPALELRDAGGVLVARNDDWHLPQPVGSRLAGTAADVTAAGTAAGAFPLRAGGSDSAVVMTLAPGAYTAVVSGKANAGGAVLVEVYELPNP